MRRCLVDPMKRYQSTFPDVQAAVKKRDQLVQEHLRMVQKVAKLETKEATGGSGNWAVLIRGSNIKTNIDNIFAFSEKNVHE